MRKFFQILLKIWSRTEIENLEEHSRLKSNFKIRQKVNVKATILNEKGKFKILKGPAVILSEGSGHGYYTIRHRGKYYMVKESCLTER